MRRPKRGASAGSGSRARSLPEDRAGSEDAAKEAALRILERGPRTVRETADRLLARGYDPDAVERALERLRRVSLLDDRAFVRAYVRTELLRRPQGRRLLVQKLARRGVPAPLVAEMEAVLAADPDLVERALESEEGRARAALAELGRKPAGRDPVSRRRRLAGALLRRGFVWDTVREVMGEELEPEH
jgi:regulatory protein